MPAIDIPAELRAAARLKRLRRCCLFLFVIPLAWTQTAPVNAFSDPASLAAELHRIEKQIQQGNAKQAVASLPASWTVRTAGRSYVISTAPLQRWSDTPDMETAWLEGVARQLEAYAPAPKSSPEDARHRLTGILARSEFAGVKPPGPAGIFWQSIRDWILNTLSEIFSFVGGETVGGKVIFFAVAIAAIVLLEMWLLGLWRSKRSRTAMPADLPLPVRTWKKWASAAREAADRGDARAAIHCCYWAAVVRLQEMHSLPPDLTYTPREYLGLLPRQDEARPPLAALTGVLERAWYANRPVSAGDLDESFNHLETLGCRP